MADEDFQVDKSITPNERAMIAGNARWAETFGPGSTNLAQRQRYQEDISAERGQRVREKEQAFNERLATDKGARDLYFKDKSAELARVKATHDMELKQQKMEMDQSRFPLQMENERLKFQVQESAMDRALRREARDANKALRVETQTDAFEEEIQGMIDNNTNPHSREFADGLAKAYAKNPYAEKNIVGQWFKNSKVEVSPEDFLAGLGELGNDPKNITATLGQNGWTFKASPKTQPTTDTLRTDEKMLDSLRARAKDPKFLDDPDYQSYLKERISTVESRLKGASSEPKAEVKTNFQNDPEGFKSAFQSAAPGTVITYNGKKYTKPGTQ
jgi:hypothetical protein